MTHRAPHIDPPTSAPSHRHSLPRTPRHPQYFLLVFGTRGVARRNLRSFAASVEYHRQHNSHPRVHLFHVVSGMGSHVYGTVCVAFRSAWLRHSHAQSRSISAQPSLRRRQANATPLGAAAAILLSCSRQDGGGLGARRRDVSGSASRLQAPQYSTLRTWPGNEATPPSPEQPLPPTSPHPTPPPPPDRTAYTEHRPVAGHAPTHAHS